MTKVLKNHKIQYKIKGIKSAFVDINPVELEVPKIKDVPIVPYISYPNLKY